jgi:hypothetical protein
MRSLKVFLEELHRRPLATRAPLLLERAQLYTSNLTGDGLGQIREFQPANSLVGRQRLAEETKDVLC